MVLALLSPALQSWYLLWGGVFVACLRLRRRAMRRFVAVVAMGLTVLWAVEWVGIPPLGGATLAALVGVAVLVVRGRPTDPAASPHAVRMSA